MKLLLFAEETSCVYTVGNLEMFRNQCKTAVFCHLGCFNGSGYREKTVFRVLLIVIELLILFN